MAAAARKHPRPASQRKRSSHANEYTSITDGIEMNNGSEEENDGAEFGEMARPSMVAALHGGDMLRRAVPTWIMRQNAMLREFEEVRYDGVL